MVVTSEVQPYSAKADRNRLAIAFAANVTMSVVGLIGWRIAHSTALLADAFDMLADATDYAVAHWAVGRSKRDQQMAARWNGAMLMGLGLSILGEVIHHWLRPDEPAALVIMGFAALSLVVNGSVLRMLSRYRHAPEPHLRATWVDTRADVLVNVGVLVSGAAIAVTGPKGTILTTPSR